MSYIESIIINFCGIMSITGHVQQREFFILLDIFRQRVYLLDKPGRENFFFFFYFFLFLLDIIWQGTLIFLDVVWQLLTA